MGHILKPLMSPLAVLPSACRHSNVVILTTSNITEKIDVAFVDRADIRQYVGLPSMAAIFKIYLSCLEELMKVMAVLPLLLVGSLSSCNSLAWLRMASPTQSKALGHGVNRLLMWKTTVLCLVG